MAQDQTELILRGVSRLIGRDLSAAELALVKSAIAANHAADADDFVAFVDARDPAFAKAFTTGRYLDAMLNVTKRVGSEKAQQMLAREESSPYFLVSSARDELEPYSLADLTSTEDPDEDEIISAFRDLLKRRRATGCAIIMNSVIYPEDEVEPTTGEPRRMEVLFGLAIARGGNRSILLPLDGGTPEWHDFTGVATGLERYAGVSADLADVP